MIILYLILLIFNQYKYYNFASKTVSTNEIHWIRVKRVRVPLLFIHVKCTCH